MEYFDREDDIHIPDSDDVSGISFQNHFIAVASFVWRDIAVCSFLLFQVFHVYIAGTEGPVVFCLHGGGYTGYD